LGATRESRQGQEGGSWKNLKEVLERRLGYEGLKAKRLGNGYCIRDEALSVQQEVECGK
jgi:hypothetical protein